MSRELTLAAASAASLPELVYQELRKAILNGLFAPGQMLRQEEVAARMGVSRSPLREALPRLEAEGIVVLHPRRGYAVAELKPEEITEVFELRVLLETEIARHSIVRRTEADIARVYELADRMRKLAETPPDAAAVVSWYDLNSAFHETLLQPAGYPHHMRALETARGLIEAYIRAETRFTGDFQQAQHEHAQLAQAFVNGHSAQFIELIREHSYHTRDRLLAGLTAHGPQPALPAA